MYISDEWLTDRQKYIKGIYSAIWLFRPRHPPWTKAPEKKVFFSINCIFCCILIKKKSRTFFLILSFFSMDLLKKITDPDSHSNIIRDTPAPALAPLFGSMRRGWRGRDDAWSWPPRRYASRPAGTPPRPGQWCLPSSGLLLQSIRLCFCTALILPETLTKLSKVMS